MTCHNDNRPVALISIIMKYIDRLIKVHIFAGLPGNLDRWQYAKIKNRSRADINSSALHRALDHHDNKSTYVRLLIIDYSSTFNTIILNNLIPKLSSLI